MTFRVDTDRDGWVQMNYEQFMKDVATITDVTIGYDDATISDNVETYGSLATSLKAVKTWLPIGGLVLGLVLLALGVLLLMRARAASRREHPGTTDRSSVLSKR